MVILWYWHKFRLGMVLQFMESKLDVSIKPQMWCDYRFVILGQAVGNVLSVSSQAAAVARRKLLT